MTTTESAAIPTLREALTAAHLYITQADADQSDYDRVLEIVTLALAPVDATALRTEDYDVICDRRDLFDFLRAAWREGQSASGEMDERERWDSATDHATKAIHGWATLEHLEHRLAASPQPAPGPILSEPLLEAAYQYSTGQKLRPQDKKLAFDFARHVAALAAPATVDRNAVLEKTASVVMGLMDLRGFFKGVPHKQVRIFGMELRNDLDVRLKAFTQPVAAPDIKQMVNRFLGWPLPKTFGPDCGIAFDGRKDDEWNKNKPWPIGTNLLTADEAKAMFEYVLEAESRAALAAHLSEPVAAVRSFGETQYALTSNYLRPYADPKLAQPATAPAPASVPQPVVPEGIPTTGYRLVRAAAVDWLMRHCRSSCERAGLCTNQGEIAAPAVAQPAAQGEALDAARWRYSMEFQDAGGDQPQVIIEMWRKVIAEGRLKPTRAEYEAATDAAIAARTQAEQSTDKPAEGV
jgi:hypothetical protein